MELPKVEPAFLKARDVPDFKTLKEYELCEALSKGINRENLLGVQKDWDALAHLSKEHRIKS